MATPVPSYPISAAFEPDGPSLNGSQRAWIAHVLADGHYAGVHSRLRFFDEAGAGLPLIVYVSDGRPDPPVGQILVHVIGTFGENLMINPARPDEGTFAIPGREQ